MKANNGNGRVLTQKDVEVFLNELPKPMREEAANFLAYRKIENLGFLGDKDLQAFHAYHERLTKIVDLGTDQRPV